MTKNNILAGWAKTGLFPFNRDRVLRDITKPAAAPPIRTACGDAGLYPQDGVVQTPVTPVSLKGLTSLLNLFTQDPHDEVSKQRHMRLIQKLGNAAQTSFARHALGQDHIRFLYKVNNEAKARRKTKSDILGKARVMTYDDLEVARVKRAEKEAAKEAKGKRKRGRKRKSAAPETDAPEPDVPEPTARVVRMSRTQVAEDAIAPGTWGAPVAPTW
ncbi:hypothetical protein BDY21DRAFT_386031 [Lineolata rhizophorae]|uniref:Uncharacterized protein n=1 Tax=Lineolata rhizophorae TaxID=578093 RepID=A0A6A6P174_9PEZI|nr:hypothetical protein BDY21DRAFT_386031 [Lineolata rhizophorae]